MKVLLLNISDIHVTTKDRPENEGLVLRKFIEDVETLVVRKKRFSFDDVFVLISGDLVFAASDDSYAKFDEIIVKELMRVLNIDRSHFIIAPGNHDVTQNAVKKVKYAFKPIFDARHNEEDFNNIIEEDDYRNIVFGKFDAFQRYMVDTMGDKNYSLQANIREINDTWSVHVLNSAILSCGGFNGIDDQGHLGVDTRSLQRFLSRDNHPKKILLMHHPEYFCMDWVSDGLRNLYGNKFALVLSGHKHSKFIYCDNSKAYIRCEAPQLFTDKNDYILGYNFIELVDDKVFKITYRQWSKFRGEFRVGSDFVDDDYSNGVIMFEMDDNKPNNPAIHITKKEGEQIKKVNITPSSNSQVQATDNKGYQSVKVSRQPEISITNLHLADDQLYPIRKNGRWGYMSKDGEILFMVERNVDRAFYFKEGVASFSIECKEKFRRKKEGFFDKSGKVIIEPKFEMVQDFSNERSIVDLYGQKGIIDKKGDWVIEPRHEVIKQLFPNIFLCDRYIYDLDGNEIELPFLVDYYGDVSEGLLPFLDYGSEKWGFINDRGEVVIEPQFDEVNEYVSFSEGLCAVRIKKKWGYINRYGRMVIKKQFDKASYFNNGLALVTFCGQIRIIDKAGNMNFEILKDIGGWSHVHVGVGIIENNDSCILFDRNGKKIREIHDVRFDRSKHGLITIRTNSTYSDSLYGLLDAQGEQLIPCKYESMHVLSDNLVAVKENQQWGLVDQKDRIIVNPQYDGIVDNGHDLLEVRKDERMGYIDRTGATIYMES